LLVGSRQELILFVASEGREAEGSTVGVEWFPFEILLGGGLGEFENVVGGRGSKGERDGFLDAPNAVHKLVIQVAALDQVGILDSLDLVLEQRGVHPLVFVRLVSQVLRPCVLIVDIFGDLGVVPHLVEMRVLRGLGEYFELRIVVIEEFGLCGALGDEAVCGEYGSVAWGLILVYYLCHDQKTLRGVF